MIERIADIPRYWAARTPSAPALRIGDTIVSYESLATLVDRAAELLRTRRVRAGDRVMIVAENSLAEVVFVFAASACGAWPVVLNARLTERELSGISAHCEPRLQVYVTAKSVAAAAHASRLAAEEVVDAGWGAVALTRTDEYAAAESDPVAAAVAAIIYTSGTTGAPKGVMLTHAGLLHFCRLSAPARRMTSGDVVYGVLPLSHIFGFATILLGTLHAGASLLLEARFTRESALRALGEGGVSMLMAVPTLFTRLMAHWREQAQQPRFPQLRYLYVGGGALDLALKQQIESAFGLPVHHGYGMTEYAGSMFVTRIERPRSDCSSGEINDGCEARFVSQGGRDVPVGAVGEILVRGPGTMLAYYRAPDLTREAITADGWLVTGDLGRLDEQGHLHLVGRIKDTIKRAGFNVYPLEIEAELNRHPTVGLSAVLGWPDASGDERIVAFVEPRTGAAVDTAILLAYLRERLAAYKCPSRIVVVAALPLTANGKVRKQELRTQL